MTRHQIGNNLQVKVIQPLVESRGRRTESCPLYTICSLRRLSLTGLSEARVRPDEILEFCDRIIARGILMRLVRSSEARARKPFAAARSCVNSGAQRDFIYAGDAWP